MRYSVADSGRLAAMYFRDGHCNHDVRLGGAIRQFRGYRGRRKRDLGVYFECRSETMNNERLRWII